MYTGLYGGLEHQAKDRDEVNRREVCKCDVMGELFIIRGKTRAKENTDRWVSV